jgi:K+-sensing histidine kinase KdpD
MAFYSVKLFNNLCWREKEKTTGNFKRCFGTGLCCRRKIVGKIDGKVIFIERTVPGDIVDIQLAKSKKDW